jgi:hypothetical protein
MSWETVSAAVVFWPDDSAGAWNTQENYGDTQLPVEQ